MRNSLLAIAVAAVLPMFAANSASAAELRLYGGGHFQGSGKGVAEAFAKKTGIAATYTPATPAAAAWRGGSKPASRWMSSS
jgi:accessory colonization factor AcfC